MPSAGSTRDELSMWRWCLGSEVRWGVGTDVAGSAHVGCVSALGPRTLRRRRCRTGLGMVSTVMARWRQSVVGWRRPMVGWWMRGVMLGVMRRVLRRVLRRASTVGRRRVAGIRRGAPDGPV